MKTLLKLGAVAVAVGLSGVACGDTVLFNNGSWIVVGTTDGTADARPINVSVGGVPVGAFSELQIQYLYTGAGFPQFFSVKGSGAMQVKMPPPGVFGGTFYLTGYWDCAAGLLPKLFIAELDLDTKATGSGFLVFNGAVRNLNSLQATDLKLKFYPPDTNLVRVEVSYKLYATRNFCVDQNKQAYAEGFRVAQMATNYVSLDECANDLASYYTTVARYCDWDYYGYNCKKVVGALCSNFDGEGYLTCFLDSLQDPHAFLVHSTNLPRNTPTLAVHFRKPSPAKINPQGYSVLTTDPAVKNVEYWGNWPKAKSSYLAGQKVGKFSFHLEAFWPGTFYCDYGACP